MSFITLFHGRAFRCLWNLHLPTWLSHERNRPRPHEGRGGKRYGAEWWAGGRGAGGRWRLAARVVRGEDSLQVARGAERSRVLIGSAAEVVRGAVSLQCVNSVCVSCAAHSVAKGGLRPRSSVPPCFGPRERSAECYELGRRGSGRSDRRSAGLGGAGWAVLADGARAWEARASTTRFRSVLADGARALPT